MKIKYKAPLIVIVIAAITAGISSYSCYQSNLRLVESAKLKELQNVAILVQNDLQEQTGKAAARASLVSSLPSIQEAFRAGDREQLARRLVPAFLIQRDKYGVREGMFHLAPATSFLRLYDVSNYGEDLSGFREMVLATNRTQEPQQGVEIGRRGLSIRGMCVVKDANGPIGSFEVGMSFSTVLENIKKNTGFEAGVFIDDERMSKIATAIPRPDSERIIGGFQNVEATNWQALRPLVSPSLLTKVTDVTYKIETINGIDYGMTLVPVLDFKGTQIGSIVAVRSFESFQTQLRANLVISLSFALLQAIILAGTILIIINVLLIRPINQLSEKLEQLAKGNSGVDIGTLARQRDEIGTIARSIEVIKGTLNHPKQQ